MPYRWVGTHPYRDHRNDRVIGPGGIFENDRIAEAHPQDVEHADGAGAVAEPQSLPDPASFSVSELRDHLNDAGYGADALDRLAAAERDGKGRTTAIDAITAARED